jgi:thiamine pyrophosphate-dependent acetolactate synthase large subunit-like protein
MSRTVAEVLVDVLEQIGVRHIFGLIGDSLNPLADAIRGSQIEWIGVRHEAGSPPLAKPSSPVALPYAPAPLAPAVTIWSPAFIATCDHAPVLALSGDMPRKLCGIDYIQMTEPDLLFRDVSLYTETVSSPVQAPAIFHQAIAGMQGAAWRS